MPNWCENNLTIQATPEQLVQDGWLIELPKAEDAHNRRFRFNLHKLFPETYPKPYAEFKRQAFNPEGGPVLNKEGVAIEFDENTFDELWDYDWCVINLGTKWDFEMYIQDIDINGNFFSCFDTARSPPVQLMETFAHQSSLTFELTYREPGMCFQGTLLSEAGAFTDNEEDFQESCETCGDTSSDVTHRDKHDEYQCDECFKETSSNN